MKTLQNWAKHFKTNQYARKFHETEVVLFFVVLTANQGEITVGEYYETGQTTEFRYCTKISEGARNFGILPGVYDEVSRN